jgi:hypothetical protein
VKDASGTFGKEALQSGYIRSEFVIVDSGSVTRDATRLSLLPHLLFIPAAIPRDFSPQYHLNRFLPFNGAPYDRFCRSLTRNRPINGKIHDFRIIHQ